MMDYIIRITIFRMNMLQKAIFKAKNAGNIVKIALPFENIVHIEQTDAFKFQQFIQISVEGIDDNFAMDEVCSSLRKKK